MVHVHNSLLGLDDRLKDVWLVVITSVSSDTQELLLWVLVLLEIVVDSHDWVCWSWLHEAPKGGEGSQGLSLDASLVDALNDLLGKHFLSVKILKLLIL